MDPKKRGHEDAQNAGTETQSITGVPTQEQHSSPLFDNDTHFTNERDWERSPPQKRSRGDSRGSTGAR